MGGDLDIQNIKQFLIANGRQWRGGGVEAGVFVLSPHNERDFLV